MNEHGSSKLPHKNLLRVHSVRCSQCILYTVVNDQCFAYITQSYMYTSIQPADKPIEYPTDSYKLLLIIMENKIEAINATAGEREREIERGRETAVLAI